MRNNMVVWATAVIVALLAGCGGGGGGSAVSGPSVTSVAISPSQFSSGGGVATIQATVTDSVTISAVIAAVTLPDSTTTVVTLSRAVGQAYYSGDFTVPANTVAGGPAQVYSVVVTMTDAASASASSQAVQLSVPAPTQPPSPPTA